MASPRRPGLLRRAMRRLELRAREGARAAGRVDGGPEETRGRVYLRLYRTGGTIRRAAVRYTLLGISAWVLFLLLFGDTGLVRLYRLHRAKQSLEERRGALEREIATLEREVGLLRDDAFTIEKVARERYGYIYPGEEVIRLVEPSP